MKDKNFDNRRFNQFTKNPTDMARFLKKLNEMWENVKENEEK